MTITRELFEEQSLVLGHLTSLSFAGSPITSASGSRLATYKQKKSVAPWNDGAPLVRYEVAEQESGRVLMTVEAVGEQSNLSRFSLEADGKKIGEFWQDDATPASRAYLELAAGRQFIFQGSLMQSEFDVLDRGKALSHHEGGFIHPAVPGQATRISFTDGVDTLERQAILASQIALEHQKLHRKDLLDIDVETPQQALRAMQQL